jgi:hypothetical protein
MKQHTKEPRDLYYMSHFPYFPGVYEPFTANKAVVVVRNPIDIWVSYLMLMITSNHSLSVENHLNDILSAQWTTLLNDFLISYKGFIQYWLNLHDNKSLPVLFVRFEDLIISKKQETLNQIFAF